MRNILVTKQSDQTRVQRLEKNGYRIYNTYRDANHAGNDACTLLNRFKTVTVIQPDAHVMKWVIYYHPSSRK